MSNSLCIYNGNDFRELLCVTEDNKFSVSGDHNIDLICGNSLTAQFNSSTVESNRRFPIQFDVSHNSNQSLPNVNDNVFPENDIFIPRKEFTEVV